MGHHAEDRALSADHIDDNRRIFTDGRKFPDEIEPTFKGYSIGQWVDTDGDGKYDVLEVETRGPFRSPRAFDASGLPLHPDGQTVVKERLYVDKSNPNIMHDEVTVIGPRADAPLDGDQELPARSQNRIRPGPRKTAARTGM